MMPNFHSGILPGHSHDFVILIFILDAVRWTLHLYGSLAMLPRLMYVQTAALSYQLPEVAERLQGLGNLRYC